jgi:hypothetical protein
MGASITDRIDRLTDRENQNFFSADGRDHAFISLDELSDRADANQPSGYVFSVSFRHTHPRLLTTVVSPDRGRRLQTPQPNDEAAGTVCTARSWHPGRHG